MFLPRLSAAMEPRGRGRARLALRDGWYSLKTSQILLARTFMVPLGLGKTWDFCTSLVLLLMAKVVEGIEPRWTGLWQWSHVLPRAWLNQFTQNSAEDSDLGKCCSPFMSTILLISELSAELRAGAQSKVTCSDALVPYNFLLLLKYLGHYPKHITKAMTVLMVDYSCAIKAFHSCCSG